MKYIKHYEAWSDYIFYGSSEEKSPEGFKFNIGDFVKFSGKVPISWRANRTNGYNKKFDNDSICVVCVVNKKDSDEYCIVPYYAPNSNYETWESEDDLELAPEEEVTQIKYNL